MSFIKSLQTISPGPWPGLNPFIFCVHHLDHFPSSKSPTSLGLDESKYLRGRDIGNDFSAKDGFSMYHGTRDGVPGFPRHPHVGFETLTVVLRGVVDHADSAGATARYGEGDAQWLTTGKGVSHSEMFPLLHYNRPNPMELFQIWIRLPAKTRQASPYFTMFWDDMQPQKTISQANGDVSLRLVAGSLVGLVGPQPPPDSWAADPNNHLVVAVIQIDPGCHFTLPKVPSSEIINRMLYSHTPNVQISLVDATTKQEKIISSPSAIELIHTSDIEIKNISKTGKAEFLLLQGKPINEPMVSRGPFVANTQAELQEKFAEYRRTEFGGWPWPSDEQVHAKDAGRFAKYPNGTISRPKSEQEQQQSTSSLKEEKNTDL
jgi:redox-sensitive bicupin YhaK (pirin superfamily)